MSETIKDIVVGVLEKGAGALIGLGVACGLVLFLPEYWQHNASLASFAKSYQTYLTLGMIGGLAVGCCMLKLWGAVFEAVFHVVAGPFLKRKLKKSLLHSVQTLSDEEWLVLAYCVNKNVTAVQLPAFHPLTQALMGKGFLVPSTNAGDVLRFSYEIQPIAWDVLTHHPSFSVRERQANASAIDSMAYRLSDWRNWK